MRQRLVSKALALTLCVQLTCPTVLLEALASPQATLPAAPLQDADLNGTWLRANGARVSIIQNGEEVSATLGPLLFRGNLRNGRLSLEFRFERVEDMPASFDPKLRPSLLGKVFRLTGIVADRNVLDLQFFGWELNPGTGEVKEAAPTAVKLTRAPPDAPDIHAVIVLEDQTRDLGYGMSSYEYPFRGNQTDSAFIYRTLFVAGRDLPGAPGPAPKLASTDKFIDYGFLRRVPRDAAGDPQAPLYERGWRALAQSGIGAEAGAGLEAVLVRATLSRGVVPGPASFTLNDAPASWLLKFGNARAEISFIRTLRGATERTSDLFLPESTAVEVLTSIDLPMDRVPVVVGRNGQPAAIGGAKTLDAMRVPGTPRVYRTAPIALRDGTAGSSAGTLEFRVALGDELQSMVANEALLVAQPVATARIHRTPAKLGKTWKEALTAAARCTGTDLTDFDKLADAQAIEITNTIVTQLERRKLRVSLGDHAAMLLLRDTFVQAMREQRANLPTVGSDKELRLLYRALAPQAEAPDFFLKPFEVSSPGLDPFDVDVTRAFSKAYLAYHFPGDPDAAERWALGALRESLTDFRQSFDAAIARAEGTTDCSVEALLDLTGVGFDAVAARLAPRLMKLQEVAGPPMRLEWVPDERGRFHVRTLGNLAAAVRAQAEFSKVDTQVLVAVVSSVAAVPGVFTKSAWAAYVAVAGDAVDAAVNTFVEVRDYYRNKSEYDFARGAASLLGQDRLREAEANFSTPVEALLNVGLNVLGGGASIRSGMTTARLARGEKLLGEVNSGGLDALRKLPESDRRNVLGFIDDAHRARAAGEKLSEAQKQALALTDRLGEQARVANSTEYHQRLAAAIKGTDAEALNPPVNVVPRDEFQRLNGSRRGQSVVRIENGKPVVYVAEGANPGALVEEAIHLQQFADPRLAPLVRKLDESKLQRWDKLDPEEQIDLYRAKLKLEIDAQRKLIKQVDAAAKAGDVGAYRQIDDAWQHLEGLRSRYGELAGLDPGQLRRTGQSGAPDWFAEPPRLFNMEPSGTHALDASVANAKTPKEFAEAYRKRFPNSSLSPSDLEQRFNQGQRLNPDTGRLRYTDSKTPPKPDVLAKYGDPDFTTYAVAGSGKGKPLPLDDGTRDKWDTLIKNRDKARTDRDALLKLVEPDEDALANALRQVNESSRQLGELGGDHFVRNQYPGAVPKYPPPGTSGSRSGDFDQVFEWLNPTTKQTEYIVVEAKGGSSRLGSRMVGSVRAEQGTRRYYEGIVEAMMKRAASNADTKTLEFLQRMNGADPSSAVRYLHVQVPINAAGAADAIRVNRFDLSALPTAVTTPPGGDDIPGTWWLPWQWSSGNAGTAGDRHRAGWRSVRPRTGMPDTARWWRHAA